MKFNKIGLFVFAIASLSVSAANDVYGTVSELVTRSGAEGDQSVYFRMNVITENSSFASCISDGNNLIWDLNLKSQVTKFQYDLLLKSYTQKLPIRIIGHDDVCENGNTSTDKVFELSPWSWDTVVNQTTENL